MKILISPFSIRLPDGKKNPKTYPYWREVVAQLRSLGHTTVQLGVSGEEEIGADHLIFNQPSHMLRGALLECDLWMSVDNFFQHFAQMYAPKKRGIVIFSRSDPDLFGYPNNINLLKNRSYLCKEQWRFWWEQEYIEDAFIQPGEIVSIVHQNIGLGVRGPEVSIVIPTHNNCQRLLRPALESLAQTTNLTDGRVEIIVVADGCTDDTVAYCQKLGVRVVINPVQLGYTKSCNLGSKHARGEYLIQLNDDIEMLHGWPTDRWLNLLLDPFKCDPQVGATGAFKKWCPHAKHPFLLGFCLCMRRATWEGLGGYDEAFSPGYGEDTDICIRIKQLGLRLVQVANPHPVLGITTEEHPKSFPIWHKGSQSIRSLPEWEEVVVKRNAELLEKRYSGSLRLDLGCGPKCCPGFVGVDAYHDNADVKVDVHDLKVFETGTVAEIQAIHLFEHLNPYVIDKTLAEWYRVLKPGGRLTLEMPDLERCCRAFVTADMVSRNTLTNCIFGTAQMEHPHLFGYYPTLLAGRLGEAGFVDMVEKPVQHKFDGCSFRMEAVKPQTKGPE